MITLAERSPRTARPSPVIGVDELREQLTAAVKPALLDVRWALGGPPARQTYEAGHLPGAHFVDLDRDLAGPPGGGGRHPLPDLDHFAAVMRRCGVGPDRLVVVYDQSSGLAAARCWWLLRYVGHDQVRLLDGGYDAWRSAGAPVSTEEPPSEQGDLVVRAGQMGVLDADGAASLATAGLLLDARSAERFRGDEEPIDPVAGHIPGARNAPTTENLVGGGRFRDPEELRRRFSALGADRAAAVGVYCGSGVTAAHQVLALELAGWPASLYVGSWSEWVSDPERPVATGD